MDAAQRKQRARLGGLTTAALGHVNVEPARLAADGRFLRDVLADAALTGHMLSESEALRRAKARRDLFYARLAYLSARARSERSLARRYGATNAATAGARLPTVTCAAEPFDEQSAT